LIQGEPNLEPGDGHGGGGAAAAAGQVVRDWICNSFC